MKYISTIFVLVVFFTLTSSSTAQTKWTKDAGNPVLEPGPAGAWDEVAASVPSVLFDGSIYHMWYNTINDNFESIGYSTSEDGITWEKYDNPATTDPPFSESDPVLSPGASESWDELGVFGPSVLLLDNTYHLWYMGVDGSGNYAIGLATSTDGIIWEKDLSNPVLEVGSAGRWDHVGIQLGSVIFDDDTYHMWYYAWDSNVRIGYAKSTDGVSWTKHEDNPVLEPSDSWEENSVRRPIVLVDGTDFQMWYSGGEYNKWRIGYATSPDGSNWTKYDNNPVLKWGAAGDWDDYAAAYCSVLKDTIDNTYKMWYSGSDTEWSYHIGYATAPVNLNVPDDYTTIQGAINAASDGNVVLVDEGTYYENINFKGKAITVASQFYMDDDASHISKTIIDGSQPTNPDSGSVVYFGSGEDTSSVLCGFTITGGSGTYNPQYSVRWGGGIACWFSGARITSNKIISNTLTGNSNWVFGGGFAAGYLGSNAYVILEKNQITNNEANSTGDGAYGGGVGLTCNGRLVDNIISYNSCTSTANEANGGGVNITAESEILPRTVMITGNRITHNFAEGKGTESPYYWAAKGGGIINQYSKILVLDNEISHNQLSDVGTGNGSGGGIYTYRAGSGSVISRNTISNNLNEVTGTKYGGGISLASNDVPVNNNIISGNSASHGGGIYCIYSYPEIINNTIVDNTASTSGGGLYSTNSNPVVINTILWDNEATSGSQIYGSGYVLYSDIQGGWSGEGNIDADPMFSDTIYHLSEESPCIDAGHDSSFFNDIEDGGIAKWPAMGTLRNDQGAYGGPKEYDITALRNLIDYILNIADEDANVALTYKLNQNYPNPFNPKTMINYQLPKTSEVEIKIYNILGQKVITLVSERQKAGNHQAQWNASGLASGIYYYSLTAGEFRDVKKMILLK